MNLRKALFTLLAGIALAAAAPVVVAQTYPNKAIRLLVPFPPGGPADILARVIAQRMGEDFGQQVIVDNRPGANTIIAAEADDMAMLRLWRVRMPGWR